MLLARRLLASLLLVALATTARAAETVWIEAEHLDGIRGYCWPMGPPAIKQTAGHWALSGPGWAAEWSQGGESGFLSIATAADDDKAAASTTVDVPESDRYAVWVRYGDWREQAEPFEIVIEQPGAAAWTGEYGRRAMIDEDNEMKLYWGWAFAWAQQPVVLKKGPARLTLRTSQKAAQPRQIDMIVLTSDVGYLPRIKDRPRADTLDVLASYRGGLPDDLEPLARTRGRFDLPEAWKVRTFRDQGFLYLWNMHAAQAPETWLSDKPERVPVPYHIADERVRKDFEQKFAGKDDVPIFSDPRIVPAFHGVGPSIFATDPQSGELLEPGKRLARWLDAHPGRPWAMMMNYANGVKIAQPGLDAFARYRDRYVGSIAGESLGYFYVDPKVMQAAVGQAQTRRQLVDAFAPPSLAANAAKYREVYGKDLDANPYVDVIPCPSIGNIAFAPLEADWGARTIGYESAAATYSLLPMRWAFMRGVARQRGTLTCTYRSCNFGDASTIFSDGSSFTSPKNILDNYYSVFSGAGMTWYKFDIWYQYMAGSSMFYHEQGFDEYWKPGGTTVAGEKEVQLSPKGKLVDRFLRVTRAQPDRGSPFTPVAFLVDYAHGWEPSPFWPNAFNNYHGLSDRFRPGDHERMLQEYFWAAWHPIGLEAQKPMTATSEVNVAGVFGDIFDVAIAYPDVAKWRTLDTYPVVIVAGEIELTAAEGQRLADYVNRGGTLLVADAHLTGPGLAALALPAVGAGRSDGLSLAERSPDAPRPAIPLSADHAWSRAGPSALVGRNARRDFVLCGARSGCGAADLSFDSARPGHRSPGRAGRAAAARAPVARTDAGRSGGRRRVAGQSHGPGLGCHAAQSGRAGQAPAGHDAHRLPPESPGDHSLPRAGQSGPRPAVVRSAAGRRGRTGALRSAGGGRADHRIGMSWRGGLARSPPRTKAKDSEPPRSSIHRRRRLMGLGRCILPPAAGGRCRYRTCRQILPAGDSVYNLPP